MAGKKSKKNINLDTERAAREEALNEAEKKAPTLTSKGKTFPLPREMPYDVAEAMAELAMSEEGDELTQFLSIQKIFVALLGDKHAEFKATRPSVADMGVLVDRVYEIYGVEVGESPAS